MTSEGGRRFRYAYGGGQPPESDEELCVDAAAVARYVAANPWPGQPPFDEIGLYENRLDAGLLGRVLALAEALDAPENEARGRGAWEGIEVSGDERTFKRYWRSNSVPAAAKPLVAEVRRIIGGLLRSPVAAIRAELKLAPAVTLELVHRGSEPVELDLRDESESRVRVLVSDADDPLKPHVDSPIDVMSARATALHFPAEARGRVTLPPGAARSYLLAATLADVVPNPPLNARVTCGVRVPFIVAARGISKLGYLLTTASG